MPYDIMTFVTFTILGTLGGLANVLVWAEHWEDLKKFSSFKAIVIGTIVGFIYTFLYSEHSFPNSVMAFVSGYMGKDFITGLIEKLKKKDER